ncbi:hypothetical protein, partial [Escherichia sp. WS533]|uniref:hypothetical protein n=1 Tax=Escherichia sp. WS533 TaxID=3382001 RepID=UPI00396C5CAA
VLNKTGPQSIHILRGVRQQQDEPGRFSICSRQAAVVRIKKKIYLFRDLFYCDLLLGSHCPVDNKDPAFKINNLERIINCE